ncbi:hypothetical protein HKX48_000798 [Thoreauomyces humboldtii]|nr:hypothetical protein HKX48_000798 [Thoreauomyces humboldtii]
MKRQFDKTKPDSILSLALEAARKRKPAEPVTKVSSTEPSASLGDAPTPAKTPVKTAVRATAKLLLPPKSAAKSAVIIPTKSAQTDAEMPASNITQMECSACQQAGRLERSSSTGQFTFEARGQPQTYRNSNRTGPPRSVSTPGMLHMVNNPEQELQRGAYQKPQTKRTASEVWEQDDNVADTVSRRQKVLPTTTDPFMTGREVLRLQSGTEYANANEDDPPPPRPRPKVKKFVSPLNAKEDPEAAQPIEPVHELLRNITPAMVSIIMNEMLDKVAEVTWDDIAGLKLAKATIKETVVFPMLRPDIFQGLRAPAKGVLLFGPPGTGKTLIGKCIASQCKASFFSISSSSLTSKYVCVNLCMFDPGLICLLSLHFVDRIFLSQHSDGEKMVRALFAVARVHQPSVIFVDEIDSLLGRRVEGEHDATRRIKTEFLVQFDGCGTNATDRILMIGATNRPQEIDEAARRRFRKKLYIPLPESEARGRIITNALSTLRHGLSEAEVKDVVERTEGYSGSDVDGLIREAALGPIRAIEDITNIQVDDIRPVVMEDLSDALTQVRASVSPGDLEMYVKFDQEFGSVNRR